MSFIIFISYLLENSKTRNLITCKSWKKENYTRVEQTDFRFGFNALADQY